MQRYDGDICADMILVIFASLCRYLLYHSYIEFIRISLVHEFSLVHELRHFNGDTWQFARLMKPSGRLGMERSQHVVTN